MPPHLARRTLPAKNALNITDARQLRIRSKRGWQSSNLGPTMQSYGHHLLTNAQAHDVP